MKFDRAIFLPEGENAGVEGGFSGEKPVIRDQASLAPGYARYRQELLASGPGLAARLTQGGMVRAALSEILPQVDVVLLDAFGVLNRGKEAIDGAAEGVARIRRAGKRLRVATNNASQSPATLERKFREMGFDFTQGEIVSSGMAVGPFVEGSEAYRGRPYYLIGTPESREAYAPDPERLMVNLPGGGRDPGEAAYLLMCSNRDYYREHQEREVGPLLRRGIPVLLANPDLAAPDHDGGLEAVAGFTVGEWRERFALGADWRVEGLGKPFPPIFRLALERLGGALDPSRVLMVGDTLETDILGGAAMGFRTCLVRSGVLSGLPDAVLDALCDARGVRPDWVAEGLDG
ncbi:MAG: HAD hydrolase-like protein [Magnetococcales bacterium]|nr:HAD hydrolase-like protein [Magnetococcales bacterium]